MFDKCTADFVLCCPIGDEDDDDDSSSGKQPLLPRQQQHDRDMQHMRRPIITITEDSPDPTRSPSWLSKRESLASGQSSRYSATFSSVFKFAVLWSVKQH